MAALVWFRHDLRIQDNPTLATACADHEQVYALYLLPQQTFAHEHHWSPRKTDLLWRHLAQLQEDLATVGVMLKVTIHDSFSQSGSIVAAFCKEVGADHVYFNAEYPVHEARRDRAVLAALKQHQLQATVSHGLLLVKPGSVCTQQGSYYKVFTPFNKAWRQAVAQRTDWQPTKPAAQCSTVSTSPSLPECPLPRTDTAADWPVGEQAILSKFGQFVGHSLGDYHHHRDRPAIEGTSKLSAYLELGVVSPKTLARSLHAMSPSFPQGLEQGADTWLTELAWREFYQHLMYFEPRLSWGENYQQQTQGLAWRDAEDDFTRWCEGRTGFPIVDAGMRQLNESGWMHNRLRMITANFLVKDLLIDWRKGEQYFMQNLIDGSFPANNGGWQWSASVGTDAVPYFRVFNPVRQSEKFDPDGSYIRKWVSELREVPTKHIHWPHPWLNKQGQHNYASPIVDHSAARERFLATFKQVKNG